MFHPRHRAGGEHTLPCLQPLANLGHIPHAAGQQEVPQQAVTRWSFRRQHIRDGAPRQGLPLMYSPILEIAQGWGLGNLLQQLLHALSELSNALHLSELLLDYSILLVNVVSTILVHESLRMRGADRVILTSTTPG